LKSGLAENDYLGKSKQLHYLRTKEGQEVDFALTDNDNKIALIIEAKLSEGDLSKNLKYFSDKYNLEGVQIVKNLKREKHLGKINIVRARDYLKELYL